MFSSRAIVFFFLCLAVVATARPVRRKACPAKPATTPVLAQPSLNVVKGAPAPVTTTDAPSSTQAPASSTKVASSTKASSTKEASETTKAASSTTKSSASPTPSAPSGGSLSGLLGKLFPVSSGKSWTVSPASDDALALSDATFRPTNILRAVPHSYTKAPDGKQAMKAHYPKGSYTFGHSPQGGFSFYAPGPSSVDLTKAKEATFGYSVYFPKGFDFNKGGKLPGLYGGNSASQAVGCSGGSRSSACFSARLMWRADGDGEFYTYLPPYTQSKFAANKAVCNVAPKSDCNPTYGASVGRGAFKFATGAWTTISERVKLNDAGKANGELELFVNGKSVISVDGLILRDSDAGKIHGMQMQTFFGGSSPDFASPKDQDLYFSDFSVAITKTL